MKVSQGRSNRFTPSPSPLSATATRLPLLLAVAFAFGAHPLPASAQTTATTEKWAPGRLLVQPRPGLSDAELDKILKPHGGRRVGRIDRINVHIVEVPANSEKAIEALLKRNKHLQFAERDMMLKSSASANDPYYANAGHLTQIGAPLAWDLSQGANVTVAILDSGVDAAHPDLAAKLVAGWNFFDNNATTADVAGHGTMVAGAAAAANNNGIGVAAVAGSALIMPIRVTDASGMGYLSYMASGITWAADRGARVANLSFEAAGGYATVQTAAQYMKNKGGLVVTAAGNAGAQQTFAASSTNIVVSATDTADVKTSWSNYGEFVDLAAPGTSIWTTTRGGGYGAVAGTSFASPVTAGVIALMMAANPGLASADIERLLFSTAADLGGPGFDTHYGNGRVNAAAAVQMAAAATASDATAPAVSVANPLSSSTVNGLVAVDVSATDNVGVSRVELMVGNTTIGTDTTAPYGFSWNSTTVPDGSATLTAYAYDAAGNYASKAVTLTVANAASTTPQPDTLPPVAQIANPTAGGRVSGVVGVKGSATDNVGVTAMHLYIDGKLVSSVAGPSLAYSWNTKKAATGSHTLVLVAEDAAGNQGSRSILVTK